MRRSLLQLETGQFAVLHHKHLQHGEHIGRRFHNVLRSEGWILVSRLWSDYLSSHLEYIKGPSFSNECLLAFERWLESWRHWATRWIPTLKLMLVIKLSCIRMKECLMGKNRESYNSNSNLQSTNLFSDMQSSWLCPHWITWLKFRTPCRSALLPFSQPELFGQWTRSKRQRITLTEYWPSRKSMVRPSFHLQDLHSFLKQKFGHDRSSQNPACWHWWVGFVGIAVGKILLGGRTGPSPSSSCLFERWGNVAGQGRSQVQRAIHLRLHFKDNLY